MPAAAQYIESLPMQMEIPPRALVANAEDGLVVSSDNQLYVTEPSPLSQHGRDPATMLRGDENPSLSPEIVTVALGGQTDCRGVDDRQ